MIVDPISGQPIGVSIPSGQSLVGQVGMDAGQSAGIAPDSVFMDMMSAIPSATVTTGWNMGRVRNTILGGGSSKEARRANSFFRSARRGDFTPSAFSYRANSGKGGMIKGGIPQTMKPRRLKRAANIDPTAYGEKSGIYSPFNFLAGMGNTAVKNAAKAPLIGERMSKKLAAWGGEGVDVTKDNAFSPGTMGRLMTSRDISLMNSKRLAKKMSNIHAAIEDINPEYFKSTFGKVMNMADYGTDMEFTRGALQGGLGSTNTGWMSGRVSGFFDAAEAAYQGNSAALNGMRAAVAKGSNYGIGMDVGERFAAGETKLGGKALQKFVGSGAARGVLKGANVASYILLAHDLAVFSGKMVGRTIDTAFDAAKSVKGSLDKPVMGIGFRDNSVAATSRQRGVMAIQNSRLNMRSVLGSEASAMHAYFG